MKKISTIIACMLLASNLFAAVNWDILDKTMDSWNADGGAATNKAWAFTKGSSTPAAGIVTQEAGYVNITKTNTGSGNNYGFLTPPAMTLTANTAYTFEVRARVKPTDKQTYPDGSYYESNQISARLNGKNMAIHLKYGDANTGYISIGAGLSHSAAEKYVINTSEWHVYRFVFHANNTTYDVYIDDMNEPVFENASAGTMSGTNILRLGAETNHRCNMDIEYAKMGTGELSLYPKISSLSLNLDSHEFDRSHPNVTAKVTTALIENGQKLLLSLVDAGGVDVVTPVELTVNNGAATGTLTIPASVPAGKYAVQVSVPGGTIDDAVINPKKAQYVIADVSPLRSKMFPQVKPVGWAVADMDDYTYKNTTNEFIFPSIIDTKANTVDGKFLNGGEPMGRYYLFYTPHENPGGMYLATSNSLDGPWTEYPGTTGMIPGTVMDYAWAATQSDIVKNGAEKHISACHVFWNDTDKQYFMYFHGPNTTTHYATSDNLVNWTFGASILNSKQFSPVGAECSYAKCFEHEIPGLGNKYVMLLMNQEGQIRRIYWAYSNDGKSWTAVPKPLVHPDLDYKKIPGTNIKPDYAGTFGTQYGNVAAPYLIERNGRYFVLCHGSSGNMFAIEVGESFDMEVHWGIYQYASQCLIDTDAAGKPVAVPRIASPQFIQDDNGKYYMFFEAGSRLGSNIAYMKEEEEGAAVSPDLTEKAPFAIQSQKGGFVLSLPDAAQVKVASLSGQTVYSATINGETLVKLPAGLYIVHVSGKAAKVLVK